eukprot:COSAG05_NODE_377_length_10608_cov_17.523361_9_plen_46_part_00
MKEVQPLPPSRLIPALKNLVASRSINLRSLLRNKSVVYGGKLNTK